MNILITSGTINLADFKKAFPRLMQQLSPNKTATTFSFSHAPAPPHNHYPTQFDDSAEQIFDSAFRDSENNSALYVVYPNREPVAPALTNSGLIASKLFFFSFAWVTDISTCRAKACRSTKKVDLNPNLSHLILSDPISSACGHEPPAPRRSSPFSQI